MTHPTRSRALQMLLLLCLALTAIACGGSTQAIKINTKANPPVAIKGYDPVAYFTDGKPLEGDPGITTEWQAATWQFASAEHRDLFVSDPEKYAPQYGGWCAFAMARGRLVDIDPAAWKIVNGKLYLNYSLPTQEFWLKQMESDIRLADENWKKLGVREE